MFRTTIEWKSADEEPPPLSHAGGRGTDYLIWTNGGARICYGHAYARQDGTIVWYEGTAGAWLVSTSGPVFWAPCPDLPR